MNAAATLPNAMCASSARTAERGPSEASRGTVLVGDGDLDLVAFAAQERTGYAIGLAAPADLLCAALAASHDAAIRQAAEAESVALASLAVAVRAWRDPRGALDPETDIAPGLQTIECRVAYALAGTTDPARVRRVFVRAERSCVVLATLRRSTHVDFHFAQADAPLALAA